MLNFEIRQSYEALWCDLVLPSATTLCNICRREYWLTVDAIMNQLPSQKKNLFCFGRVDINQQTSHNIGHCLLHGSKLDIAWSPAHVWMRLIAYSLSSSEANWAWLVKGSHTVTMVAVHLKDFHDCIELTDGRLIGIMNDYCSLNYLITHKLRSMLEASRIEWPALWNHIPCMVHVILLALGAFMISIAFTGHIKSSEAQERNQQFGENDSIDIRKSQRLWNEGNAWMHKVLATRPCFAKIFEKEHNSRNFEYPDTELDIAQNACCIDYADTGLSKWVHWLSKSHSSNRGATHYGCDDTLEFDTGVAWVSGLITRTNLQVATESKTQ